MCVCVCVCVCVSRLCCLNTENKRKEIRTIQTGTEQEQDRIRNFLGKKYMCILYFLRGIYPEGEIKLSYENHM